MNIEHFLGYWAKGIHDQGANRDVGNETTIHDINVDPVSASLVNIHDLQSHYLYLEYRISEWNRESYTATVCNAHLFGFNVRLHSAVAPSSRGTVLDR